MSGITTAAVGLIVLTSTALLVSENWRISILALSFQYIGVFLLVAVRWPLETAVVKLLAGWVAGSVLGFILAADVKLSDTVEMDAERETRNLPTGRLFRLMVSGFVLLVVRSVAPGMLDWIPGIDQMQLYGGLILMGSGLLHLGLTNQTFRTILGLLTFLSGTEILLSAVETSILVTGLLAFVNLALALTGAYLLMVHGGESRA